MAEGENAGAPGGDSGCFKINICGQLEWVEIPDAGNQIHCHLEIISGTDWKVLTGIESIVSQIATAGCLGFKYIINLPINILLQSTSPSGWPQIVLGVYNGEKCMGLARVHIPIRLQSNQQITVPLSRPLASTPLAEIMGKRPGIRDLKLLTEPNALQLLRMESCGVANFSLNVTAQGLRALGYDIG